MDLNKINAFLATAIGGLIFKWLAGAVKSTWSWLNKIHPEEQFLVDELGIKKHHIRLSYTKYKRSTKEHTHKQSLVIKAFGLCVILISLAFAFAYFYFLITKPIYWIEYEYNVTNETVWLRPGIAKNPQGSPYWRINSDTCINSKAMERITTISPKTKEMVCNYIFDPQSQIDIAKAIDKNSVAIMVVTPIVLLSLVFFLSLGIGVFIELRITQKISEYNKKELAKSYQYLT